MTSRTRTLVSAAVGGIVLGLAGCSSKGEPAGAGNTSTLAGAPGAGSAAPKSKHACRGQNACKGQGGCGTDAHACKGQNACKGQGGCTMT